jgi:hypothetical protein
MNIEQFVNDYLQEHHHDVLLNPYNGLIDFANAFKGQMMKEAMEGKIIYLLNGDVAINIGDIDEYKLGKKVRVIVLPKEDSHE